MKKTFKTFLALMLTLLSFNVNTVSALEGSITAKDTEKVKITKNEVSDYFTYLKLTSDDRFIYCAEYDKIYARGQVLNNAKLGDPGVAYIIANGLNGKYDGNFSNELKSKFYDTQIAIHVYLGQFTIKENNDYKNKIDAMVKKAKEYKENASKELTVQLNSNNVNMSIKDEYYVTDAVKVSANRSDALLNVTSNIGEVVNSNKEVVKEVKNGDTVFVRIKKADVKQSTEVKLTLQASAKDYKTTYYYPKDSKYQPMADSDIKVTELNKSTELTFKAVVEGAKKSKVKISKQDITTKEELPGATLVIKDANGKVIDKWISTNEAHYVELEAGSYTLTEIQAPDGYVLSKETIDFVVDVNGTVDTEVVMYNAKAVDVPITSANASIIAIGLGVLGMLFGAFKVFKNI